MRIFLERKKKSEKPIFVKWTSPYSYAQVNRNPNNNKYTSLKRKKGGVANANRRIEPGSDEECESV